MFAVASELVIPPDKTVESHSESGSDFEQNRSLHRDVARRHMRTKVARLLVAAITFTFGVSATLAWTMLSRLHANMPLPSLVESSLRKVNEPMARANSPIANT